LGIDLGWPKLVGQRDRPRRNGGIFSLIGSYPALARLPIDALFVALRSGDPSGAILFGTFAGGTGIPGDRPHVSVSATGDFCAGAPALTFHNGTLHMAYIDGQQNLWHSIMDINNETWSRKRIEGQWSWGTPALASFNGRLHMVHPGKSSTNI
jgi:hypothetical protein